MDCLKGFIGYRSRSDYDSSLTPQEASETFSGLYVNSLPGISFVEVEALADDAEQVDDRGLWDEVEFRGLLKFSLAVKAELNKSYSISDSVVVKCLLCEAKESFAVALWYFLGVELMIERTSSDRLNRYTTIDLEKAERLKGEYYAEFQTALADAVGSMNPADSDCVEDCVSCEDSIRWIEQTP